MGNGLYINYNDGRPAMEITANLRCPGLARNFVGVAGRRQETIGEIIPGAEPFFIPSMAAQYQQPSGTAVIGNIYWLRSVSFSGQTMIQDRRNGDISENSMAGGAVWQFYPIGVMGSNRGLLIQNSTDFSVITDTGKIATCVWSGWLAVNGDTNLPVDGLVFAKWDSPNVSLVKEGAKLKAYVESTGYDNVAGSVNVYLAIFAVSPPTPGIGLNIFNAAGTCTFSTTRKPLVVGGFRQFNSSWQDIGNNMVPLGSNGYQSANAGGFCNMRLKGLMMSGNSVRTGNNAVSWRWTDRYSITGNENCSLNTPIIPFIY